MRASSWFAIAFLFAPSSAALAQVGKSANMVDPNIATEQQLATLPGLTPALAKTIVAGRPFTSMIELNALLAKSLKPEQLTALYRTMFIHLNLNSASKDEIMLIPGMGPKMHHEFEEYRPYKALAQFRREIGKYVDAAELARLESYVFVPMNVNTASDADLMTIPGLGPKMLHEFKEYRPYKSIEQFRREIGKYVSAKEVARYERYLTLN
ncbi:MAG: hypothetical protein FJ206_17005 [Gemmatimonadetes bacterium]|nr:hypothetical protein [Gemmatimonadota bacterium]